MMITYHNDNLFKFIIMIILIEIIILIIRNKFKAIPNVTV